MTRIMLAAGVLMISYLSGCATDVHSTTRHMTELPAVMFVEPDPNKALIIFMRPGSRYYRQMSSVFEVTSGGIDLIGVIPNMKKVAYQADPGQYVFMVLSEVTDYISADVEAGSVYFIRVVERDGFWKMRYSLLPISRADISNREYKPWFENTRYMEITASAHQWYSKNRNVIEKKHRINYKKWKRKPEANRPSLAVEDGISPMKARDLQTP